MSGLLTDFIIEPFVKHEQVLNNETMTVDMHNTIPYHTIQSDEHYVCIVAGRDGDTILFHHEGGVDVGDVDSKVCMCL